MPHQSEEAKSELQRVRRADTTGLIDALQRLIDNGEALDEAATIVEQRIGAGDYVTPEVLARLIAKTQRKSLFALVREKLLQDRWSLLTLYEAHYPDPAVEQMLVDLLYTTAENDSEPIRHYIVDAICEHGTTAALPVLEAILYDLAPTKGVKNAIASALFSSSGPTLEALLATSTAKSRGGFVDAVAKAIRAVRDRNADPNDTVSGTPLAVEQLVSNAHKELEDANRYVKEDPTYAVVCLRRGAEAMGKHLYRTLGHEKTGKPAKKMMLDELLKPIKDSDAPDVFKICIQALQPFGNYAAHDQDESSESLTPQVGEALIEIFRSALTIYEQWLHNLDVSAN